MRLIDADKLQKPIYASDDNIVGIGMLPEEIDAYNNGINEAWRRIENAPTAITDKETPRPPVMWGDGYCDGDLVMEYYECENCGAMYEFETDGKFRYCPNCGQALDWTED